MFGLGHRDHDTKCAANLYNRSWQALGVPLFVGKRRVLEFICVEIHRFRAFLAYIPGLVRIGLGKAGRAFNRYGRRIRRIPPTLHGQATCRCIGYIESKLEGIACPPRSIAVSDNQEFLR